MDRKASNEDLTASRVTSELFCSVSFPTFALVAKRAR